MSRGKTPVFWAEARCASVCADLGDNWGLPKLCEQTSEGLFTNDTRRARRFFESKGWVVGEGEWWCPHCARLRFG